MNIKAIGQAAHKNSKAKGFWNHTFNIPAKMEQSGFFSPEEIKAVKKAFSSQKLLLIISEITEAMEADRKDKTTNLDDFNSRLLEINNSMPNPSQEDLDNNFKTLFESRVKDSQGDELADGLIRLVEFAEGMDIDLTAHTELKMRYNLMRPAMHGKNF